MSCTVHPKIKSAELSRVNAHVLYYVTINIIIRNTRNPQQRW